MAMCEKETYLKGVSGEDGIENIDKRNIKRRGKN
jgi:hypothetical protein